MTVIDALHKLWSDSGELNRRDKKDLWMTLQSFIEEKGGRYVSVKHHAPIHSKYKNNPMETP